MVGDIVSKLELKGWLNDCHSGQFIDIWPMPPPGFRPHLVRGRPGGRLTVAVGGDARPETAINAMLDLLAWHWIERRRPADAVDLLIGDGPNAAKVLGALRTLVATHAGRPNVDLYRVARAGATLQSQEAERSAASARRCRSARWAALD